MIKRHKKTYRNVEIKLLGQIRTVEDVHVTIEVDTRNQKRIMIMTLEERNRLEAREHDKIMKLMRGQK